MKNNSLKKEIKKNGYYIWREFFSKPEMNEITNIADLYSKEIIKNWVKNTKDLNKIFVENDSRLKIIDHYKRYNKPNYRRDPQKNLANKEFFKMVNSEKFKCFKSIIGAKNFYFSFIKNLRFKSRLLPWSISRWHCDRFTFKEFKDKNMKFLIFWIPLQNVTKKTGGGVELIHKKKFSFNDISNKNFINKKKEELFHMNDYQKKFDNYKKIVPELKFGDLLIIESSTIHKTSDYNKIKPFWSMDLRFEYGSKVTQLTKKAGFNMFSDPIKNYKKFENSKNLKI